MTIFLAYTAFMSSLFVMSIVLILKCRKAEHEEVDSTDSHSHSRMCDTNAQSWESTEDQ